MVVFFRVILPEYPEEIFIPATAGCRVAECFQQGGLHIGREYFFCEELCEDLPEFVFPLGAVRLHPVAEPFVSEKMRQFMQQGYQETVFVEVAIDADPVRLAFMCMPVIAQDTLALPRYR